MRWVSPILQSVSLDGGGMGHRPDRQHGSTAGRTGQPLYCPNRKGDTNANDGVLFGTESQAINLAVVCASSVSHSGGREGQWQGLSG